MTVTRAKKRTLYNDERIDPTKSTIVQIYAANIGASKYIKQVLASIKGEIDSNTMLAGEFSIPLTSMNASSRLKTHNKMLVLNDTLKQMNFLCVCVCVGGGRRRERKYSTLKQQNTHSFQVHMEYSPG